MELEKLDIKSYVEAIKTKKWTALFGVQYFIDRIKKSTKNAIIEIFNDSIDIAKNIDKNLSKNNTVGRLFGVPIVIKDNILYKNHISSAGSQILKNFVSPYSATVVEKLLKEGAIIIGRANMDEFGMGSTGENSSYGVTHNAFRDGYVAGGSSSGSAVAVAEGLCIASLGTDTGASVRTPASYNGLFAIKPTYGAVSRFGIVAYASGLEQVGAIAKTSDDLDILQDVISGVDKMDGTCNVSLEEYKNNFDIKKIKVGFIKNIWDKKNSFENYDKYIKLFDWFKDNGAEIIDINIDMIDTCLPAYYILATAQAASNLSRFDGIKYTARAKNCKNLDDVYTNTRTEYFGSEVKRRIMLGNFVLSSGYFDAYYKKAQKIQSHIKNEFKKVFESVDILLMPITISDAIKIGEKTKDPVQMYLEDIFTVPANVSGVPSLAIPFEKGERGLPIGFQIMGNHCNDKLLIEVAKYFESNFKVK